MIDPWMATWFEYRGVGSLRDRAGGRSVGIRDSYSSAYNVATMIPSQGISLPAFVASFHLLLARPLASALPPRNHAATSH